MNPPRTEQDYEDLLLVWGERMIEPLNELRLAVFYELEGQVRAIGATPTLEAVAQVEDWFEQAGFLGARVDQLHRWLDGTKLRARARLTLDEATKAEVEQAQRLLDELLAEEEVPGNDK